jgi:hypothetical protein
MMSFYENSFNLAVRINDYKEAIDLVNNSFQILDRIGSIEQITKYIASVVIIHLSRDDWVSGKSFWDNMKSKYALLKLS